MTILGITDGISCGAAVTQERSTASGGERGGSDPAQDGVRLPAPGHRGGDEACGRRPERRRSRLRGEHQCSLGRWHSGFRGLVRGQRSAYSQFDPGGRRPTRSAGRHGAWPRRALLQGAISDFRPAPARHSAHRARNSASPLRSSSSITIWRTRPALTSPAASGTPWWSPWMAAATAAAPRVRRPRWPFRAFGHHQGIRLLGNYYAYVTHICGFKAQSTKARSQALPLTESRVSSTCSIPSSRSRTAS